MSFAKVVGIGSYEYNEEEFYNDWLDDEDEKSEEKKFSYWPEEPAQKQERYTVSPQPIASHLQTGCGVDFLVVFR